MADDFLNRWHSVIADMDGEALRGLIAEDATFRSPVFWTATEGREQVATILMAAAAILQDFTYEVEVAGGVEGRDLMLMFEARVGDRTVRGIDRIRLNDDGLIAEFEVFVRPASALMVLGEAMAKELGLSAS